MPSPDSGGGGGGLGQILELWNAARNTPDRNSTESKQIKAANAAGYTRAAGYTTAQQIAVGQGIRGNFQTVGEGPAAGAVRGPPSGAPATSIGTYTSGADGYVYPNPPANWRGGIALWEELSRTMGQRQPPRVTSPAPPRPPTTPPINPNAPGPRYTPTGATGGVPNFVTRELVAESWFILGQNLQRELARRSAERIKAQVEGKKGPRTRGGRRRRIVKVKDPAKEAMARITLRNASLENVKITARPMLEPVQITAQRALEPVQVTARRLPTPTAPPKPASRLRTLSSWLLPRVPDLLRFASPQDRARSRRRDPLTTPQTQGLPFPSQVPQPQAFGAGAFSFTSGNQTCTCKDQGPKKKKRKQKRETCYRGTYTETSTGLIKRKARRVPCK